jgi:GNAT superfamily N-acetyltransferase
VRRAQLTRKGLAERAELDRRADDVAARILEPLSVSQRATLVDAMTKVERLLQASMVRFAVEDPASPDAQWCLEQYFAEISERFEGGFDRARVLPATAPEMTPPAGAFIVARLRDKPVGCGGLKFHGDEPAELKRMWLSPAVRGMGLGERLLQELERHAREAGVKVLRLETNRALREAIALYRKSGWVEVDRFNDEPHAHHWFEKRLV